MVAFELGPAFPAIDRYPETKLRSKEKQIRFFQIFFDHVRISANTFCVLRADQQCPGFTVVGRAKNVRSHVAECMSIKRGVGGGRIEVAGLDPAHPRIFRQAGNIAGDVCTGLTGLARWLESATM